MTTCVSKNGATGNPWNNGKVNKEGKVKNRRHSAGDIEITALPELKIARPWFAGIDATVLQQNAGGVTTPPETQTGLIFDRLVLKKDRSDESYTRPIRIYVT